MDPLNANEFDYSSLPLDSTEDEIRLLKLHDDTLGICCSLATFPLEEAPRYAAISYQWGEKNITKPIYCNGAGQISVTTNLHELLQFALQSGTFRRHEHQWIWVDAVCMNQEDTCERSAQVAMMKRIYERASTTFIWLGRPTESSEKFFELVGKVNSCRAKYDNAQESRRYDNMDKKSQQSYGLSQETEGFYGDFGPKYLLAHGWFTRVWVIQELAVSQNPLFVTQHSEVSWQSVMDAALFWWRVHGSPSHSFNYSWDFVLHDFRESVQTKSPTPLLQCLRAACRFSCTDPRDRIFALLGMAVQSSSEDVTIQPDYSKNTEEIYVGVAGNLLQGGDYFDVLNVSHRSRDFSSLPSWVPDWRYTDPDVLPFAPLRRPGHRSPFRSRVVSLFLNFKTCPTARIKDNDIFKDGTLRLHGISLSAVLDTTFKPQWKEFFEEVSEFLEVGEAVCDAGSPGPYPMNTEATIDAFWRTLLAGQFEYSPARGRQMLSSLEKMSLKIRRLSTLCSRARSWLPFPLDLLVSKAIRWYTSRQKRKLLKSQLGRDLELFAFAVMYVTNCRKVFRTKAGHIGLGPGDMRECDDIFLVKGCRTPMALRQAETADRWTLVGACYVHGIMQGQAFAEDLCHEILLV